MQQLIAKYGSKLLAGVAVGAGGAFLYRKATKRFPKSYTFSELPEAPKSLVAEKIASPEKLLFTWGIDKDGEVAVNVVGTNQKRVS